MRYVGVCILFLISLTAYSQSVARLLNAGMWCISLQILQFD